MAAEKMKISLDELAEMEGTKPVAELLVAYKTLVFTEGSDADVVKLKERAIGKIASLLLKEKNGKGLSGLLSELRPLFTTIPKAKTAKIVRLVIDTLAKIEGTTELQVSILGSFYCACRSSAVCIL
jgi:26S proteasome regulatory subunit N6